MKLNTKLRILEFIIAGLVLDLTENLIAIRLTTETPFSWNLVWIAFLVVIPFAIVTELVIDHPRFWHKLFRIKS